MHEPQTNTLRADGLRIGLVCSTWHRDITDRMRRAAVEAFLDAGGHEDDLLQVDAPGAWELLPLAAALAARDDIDAVVTIGCVIAGETTHDQWINTGLATGLAHVSVRSKKAIALGVLTCSTMEQALARSGSATSDKGNKGHDAMRAAIETTCTLKILRHQEAQA
jgi:6,7-dimethyl-8-ribityllumazine synthase